MLQPVGRADIVEVVGFNVDEQLRIPGFFPAFVINDAGTGIGDVARALLQIKVLHVLDRVARLGHPDALPHYLVQINQLVVTQQVVDFGFARTVQRHELLESRLFVMGVVINMARRMLVQPHRHEIHKCFKRLLFVGAVVSPECLELRLAALKIVQAEQVFKSAFLKRVAFHIKKQVSVTWPWQARKAANRIAVLRQQLQLIHACLSCQQLQSRLAMQFFQRIRRHFRNPCLISQRSEGFKGRHASQLQFGDLQLTDVGNLAEMVIGASPLLAQSAPFAQTAFFTRNRVSFHSLAGNAFKKALADEPEISRVVRATVRHLSAVAEHDMHVMRFKALCLAHQFRIEPQLNDEFGFRAPSQLCIYDLVAPIT